MFVVGVFLRKTFLSNIFPKGKFNFRSQLRHFLPDLENVALFFEKLFLSHLTQWTTRGVYWSFLYFYLRMSRPCPPLFTYSAECGLTPQLAHCAQCELTWLILMTTSSLSRQQFILTTPSPTEMETWPRHYHTREGPLQILLCYLMEFIQVGDEFLESIKLMK